MSDIAEVTDSVQNVRAAGYLNTKRAIPIIIFREPGANIIATVDRIRAQLDAIKASIPLGIHMTIVLDRTTTIRASVADVERTLMISIVLVIIVVFVFLRNGRATLIPGVAVPVSLIGTCAVMYLCGYSLDNLSLMALTIATGFVVDDAIVVMENITRHLESGMTPMEAALKGAQEIGFTVFSISVSLVAVFIPILLMGGIVGRLFREFAVTLSTAILVSMVISLTTTPMMCAYPAQAREGTEARPPLHAQRTVFRRDAVALSLQPDVGAGKPRPHAHGIGSDHRAQRILAVKMPKGFFPQQDTGAITGGLQGPQDASFDVMDKSVRQIAKVIKDDPAVANVICFTGGQGATNSGFVYVALKPLSERKIGAPEIINRLRPKLDHLQAASVFLQAAQDLRIGGRGQQRTLPIHAPGRQLAELAHWGPVLLKEMKHLPGFTDVNSDQQNGGRDELADL